MKDWQLTFTGRKVYPARPDASVIDIEDIAHHLALENRYCGAIKWPYSVAQHCVLLAQYAPPDIALEALLHDAGEYLMRDLPQPVKGTVDVTEHTRLEREWTREAMTVFGVESTPYSRDMVKALDTRIVLDETAVLSTRPELYIEALPGVTKLGVQIEKWSWEWAKIRFLETFDQLYNNRGWY